MTDHNPPVNPFAVSTDRDGDDAFVRLQGELDIATAARVETELRALEDAGVTAITLDLRGLSFMDSTGLRILVAADTRAREGGWRLTVVRGPAAVQRVLEMTGLDQHLTLVDEPAGELSAKSEPS